MVRPSRLERLVRFGKAFYTNALRTEAQLTDAAVNAEMKDSWLWQRSESLQQEHGYDAATGQPLRDHKIPRIPFVGPDQARIHIDPQMRNFKRSLNKP